MIKLSQKDAEYEEHLRHAAKFTVDGREDHVGFLLKLLDMERKASAEHLTVIKSIANGRQNPAGYANAYLLTNMEP